jgi:hypothetical protein
MPEQGVDPAQRAAAAGRDGALAGGGGVGSERGESGGVVPRPAHLNGHHAGYSGQPGLRGAGDALLGDQNENGSKGFSTYSPVSAPLGRVESYGASERQASAPNSGGLATGVGGSPQGAGAEGWKGAPGSPQYWAGATAQPSPTSSGSAAGQGGHGVPGLQSLAWRADPYVSTQRVRAPPVRPPRPRP